MKKQHQNLALFLSALLCVGAVGVGSAALETETVAAEGVAISETYSFGDLPYHTGYSNFGYYDAGFTDYTMKVGMFDPNAENFNLKAYDTWSDDKNAVTLSSVPGLEARNWKWSFAANTTVVVEVKSQIIGTIAFDFTGVTLGGWFDGWPSIFGLYKYTAADDSVTTIARNFQNDAAKPLDSATYTHTVSVAEGDIVYFEIGKCNDNGYNIQEVHKGKIIVTPTAVNTTVVSSYGKKLDALVGGLTQANYAESDWTTIGEIVSTFKSGTYASADELVGAYNKAVEDINAIKPDPLKDKRTVLVNQMNAYVGGLKATNYTESDWAVITAASQAFIGGAQACETEAALEQLFDEKMAEIKAVKAYKQTFVYLDYPSKMNANGYDWIGGEIFDTKLYAGTVKNLKEFNAQGDSEHIMYNTDLNAGLSTPAYYAQNWKWVIGYNAGVISAFKANVDLKLTFTNDRLASGQGNNGWTEETAIVCYIVRGEDVKDIYTINAPSKDEHFSGSFYLKAGDMLYVEFNSTVINIGDVRNTEAPCNMKVEADSTGFNNDAYVEQNHDLPQDVVNEINAKKAALEEYYAGLKEEDYSATNWLTLAQYIEQFVEKCDTEVETIEDVTALYNSIKAEMEAVPTLAQAADELKTALEGYAAEVQAQYDALVKDNVYTTENKAKLDKTLADAKAAILAAKSKTVGNQEKTKALAALKAVETEKPVDESNGSAGCMSSIAGLMVAPVMVAFGAVVAMKKKED